MGTRSSLFTAFVFLCLFSPPLLGNLAGSPVVPNHIAQELLRQQRERAGTETDLSVQIRNINSALTSPDPRTVSQAYQAARTLVNLGQASPQQFSMNGGNISNLLRTPTLGIVDLSRNTNLSPRDRELALIAAQTNLGEWQRGMAERGLNPLAFQRAVASHNGTTATPEQRQLASQFGKMLGKRFDLGLLPGGADAGMSNQMRAIWQRAQALANGAQPANDFDRAILAEYKKSEANRQAFWNAMAVANQTGNAEGLRNWTENFPNFLKNLQSTEANVRSGQTQITGQQAQFYEQAQRQISNLFGVSSVSQIRLEQDFIAQANRIQANRIQANRRQVASGGSQVSPRPADVGAVSTGQDAAPALPR